MEKKIRVGLVGYGMSGQVFHAPFLHTSPLYDLVAVVERNQALAVQRYPYVQTERTIQALLKRNDIDLVVITTPNETHYPYTEAALMAGRHVVLEKPFANSTAEAMRLVELSKSADNKLSVYQNRRYVGDFKTIKSLLKQGSLGQVHEYLCHFDRYRTEPREGNAWREKPLPGSGVLFDLGSHLIDQALYLFGLPQYITAQLKMQRPFSVVDDYFDLRLDYANGTTAILKSSMLVREMGPRYAVHGTLGSYLKYGDDPQEALLRQGHLPVGAQWGEEPAMQHGILHTQYPDGTIRRETIPTQQGNYGEYYQNLYAALMQGAPLREKAEHGYNTIRIIELAFESHEKRCTLECTGLMDAGYPGL
jgi:predicted dehydrogenase